MPVFSATAHDISINGQGYVVPQGGSVQRQDLTPASSRAAVGEGRLAIFETESFVGQADWEGGMGQERLRAADAFLCGLGDSRWQGKFFPPRKVLTEAGSGGTTHGYVAMGSSTTLEGDGAGVTTSEALWGYVQEGTNSRLEKIGVATNAGSLGANATLVERIEHSGYGHAFFVNQTSAGVRTLRRFDGSAVSDVTPPGLTPSLVKRFGKWLFCLGQQTIESTVALVQSAEAGATASNVVFGSFGAATQPGSCIVAVVQAMLTGSDAGTVFTTDTDYPWQYIGKVGGSGTARVEVYILPDASVLKANTVLRFNYTPTTAENVDLRLNLLEVSGIDPDAVDVITTSQATASSATSPIALTGPASGTLSRSKGFALSVAAARDSVTDDVTSATAEAGWTELDDTRMTGSTPDTLLHLSYKVLAATTSEEETKTFTLSGSAAGTLTADFLLLVLKGNLHSADFRRFALAYTEDEGMTWDDIGAVASSGINVPVAAMAAQGFLWFTTSRGLFRLAVDEHEFEDHQVKLIVGIQGPLDRFDVPYDAGSTGTHLVVWDGQLFYNLGATVRRLAPGGEGSQIWPPEGWAGPVSKVQAVVAGEGGVYFSAGGFLYCYNGRGFHCLAQEASAGQFDVLHFYQGKLYLKGDPAPYLDFRYPSTRPDVVFTAPTNFTTGYLVMSEVDFEKVNVRKVVTQFELHAHWTAATDSGTLALHYLADPTVEDPGRAGGGATSLTWVSVGTMTVADGNTKTFTLGTPLVCKRLFLRVTITPGTTNGYPTVEAVAAYGRSVMPSLKRIVATLDISTDTRDRTGAVMYPDDADVKAAVDALVALREATSVTYFTVGFRDEMAGTESYTCTAEAMTDWLVGTKRGDSMAWTVQFAATEVPS